MVLRQKLSFLKTYLPFVLSFAVLHWLPDCGSSGAGTRGGRARSSRRLAKKALRDDPVLCASAPALRPSAALTLAAASASPHGNSVLVASLGPAGEFSRTFKSRQEYLSHIGPSACRLCLAWSS